MEVKNVQNAPALEIKGLRKEYSRKREDYGTGR